MLSTRLLARANPRFQSTAHLLVLLGMHSLLPVSHFLLAYVSDLTSSGAAPVQVKGHAGQVLAMTFVPPFNVLVTSGEKDRTVRCVR